MVSIYLYPTLKTETQASVTLCCINPRIHTCAFSGKGHLASVVAFHVTQWLYSAADRICSATD